MREEGRKESKNEKRRRKGRMDGKNEEEERKKEKEETWKRGNLEEKATEILLW